MKGTSLHQFQQLAGRLQHASIAIPGGNSLFTPLDMAMRGDPTTIHITPIIQEALGDWCTLVQHLKRHPTSVLQLVRQPPHFISYIDACGLGAGGVWCSGTQQLNTFL